MPSTNGAETGVKVRPEPRNAKPMDGKTNNENVA